MCVLVLLCQMVGSRSFLPSTEECQRVLYCFLSVRKCRRAAGGKSICGRGGWVGGGSCVMW